MILKYFYFFNKNKYKKIIFKIYFCDQIWHKWHNFNGKYIVILCKIKGILVIYFIILLYLLHYDFLDSIPYMI